MNADTIARLKDAAGPNGLSEDPAEIAPHLEEWRSKYQGRSPLLLKPATTAQVSAILAICNETAHAPSCRRAAIPDWSAAKFRSTAKYCSVSRA